MSDKPRRSVLLKQLGPVVDLSRVFLRRISVPLKTLGKILMHPSASMVGRFQQLGSAR